MKTIKIERPVNLNLLTDELFDTFPEWRYINPFDGKPMTDVTITPDEIMFPDTTDEAAVLAVLAAHDDKGKSKNQKNKEAKDKKRADMRRAINTAVSVEELRDTLLAMLEEL